MAAAVIAMLPNLMFLAILFVVVRYLLRLLRLFFEAIEHGSVTFAGFDRVGSAHFSHCARSGGGVRRRRGLPVSSRLAV